MTGQVALSRRLHARGELSRQPVAWSLVAIPVRETPAFHSLRETVRAGIVVSAVAVIAGFLLMAQTSLDGAVITTGTLVVESGAKKVQHISGGIVSRILVADGDRVTSGQPLLLLDQTVTQAKRRAAALSLVQQQARLARLVAERDRLLTPAFPTNESGGAVSGEEFAAVVASEQAQFDIRRETREGQKSALRQQISQTDDLAAADRAQIVAKQAQRDEYQSQADKLTPLYDKKLIPYQRLADVQQAIMRLDGDIGALQSSIAQSKGKVAELAIQVLQVDQTQRSDLTNELAQAQSTIADLRQQLVVADDALAHSTIVAPDDGIVHELDVHTVGGVVQPASTLMEIVPLHDRLIGEVHVRPADIDQIYPGQPATLEFTSFDRGTTPNLLATLLEVSPDLTTDPRTGLAYYTARIAANTGQVDRLSPELKLVAGMPIEAFIKTEKRTIASYMLKPILDQIDRAFR